MDNQTYLSTVAPYAQSTMSKYGVYASVGIAMSCVESTWGNSTEANSSDHNILGIKTPGNHNPNLTIGNGKPATDDGGYYCAYQSWADCFDDYGYFLRNNSRYPDAGVFTATSAKAQLQCIMNAGYAGQAYYDMACQIIDYNNLTQYDTGSLGGGTDENAKKVESAVTWLINISNDNTHGYDQDNRWGPDYDCSSFIISGFEQAGIPLKTNGASYTGDLKSVALATGFKEVAWNNDVNNLVRGDIILNETHHVCCYIGNGQIVQASINENGTTTGGQTGDQTGTEIYVRDYYVYSSGWDCVLRFGNGSSGSGGSGEYGDDYFTVYESYFNKYDDLSAVYKKLLTTPYIMKQLSTEYINFLRTLNFNDHVQMKFTYNHNKRQIGKNYLGKKLTFDNKGYIIKDVKNNGLIVLAYGGSSCYNYINPSLLYQTEEEKTETKNNNVDKIKQHKADELAEKKEGV